MKWLNYILALTVTTVVSVENTQAMKPLRDDLGIEVRELDALHCPSCRLPLKRTETLDILMQGLRCEQNHRFYIPLKLPLTQAQADEQDIRSMVPFQGDDRTVIREWLSNLTPRSLLNDQLATILRRIYEITTADIHVVYVPSAAHTYLIFKYCPLCTEPLNPFDQEDVWVQGLQCSKGHQFKLRNGIGFSMGSDKRIRLEEEMADETLHQSISWWLKSNNPRIKQQLHPQIRAILERFQSAGLDSITGSAPPGID